MSLHHSARCTHNIVIKLDRLAKFQLNRLDVTSSLKFSCKIVCFVSFLLNTNKQIFIFILILLWRCELWIFQNSKMFLKARMSYFLDDSSPILPHSHQFRQTYLGKCFIACFVQSFLLSTTLNKVSTNYAYNSIVFSASFDEFGCVTYINICRSFWRFSTHFDKCDIFYSMREVNVRPHVLAILGLIISA